MKYRFFKTPSFFFPYTFHTRLLSPYIFIAKPDKEQTLPTNAAFLRTSFPVNLLIYPKEVKASQKYKF